MKMYGLTEKQERCYQCYMSYNDNRTTHDPDCNIYEDISRLPGMINPTTMTCPYLQTIDNDITKLIFEGENAVLTFGGIARKVIDTLKEKGEKDDTRTTT
jgi:hypothetical protein